VLQEALVRQEVPAAEHGEISPVETDEGRRVLAILRLLADPQDSLAWRTVLQLHQGIGSGCLRAVRGFARRRSIRFSTALQAVAVNPQSVARVGKRIARAVSEYMSLLKSLTKDGSALPEQIQRVVRAVVPDEAKGLAVADFLICIAEEAGAASLAELVSAFGASLDAAEQELAEGCVNILTMHKAKGLSADAVFIVGAEDEFIPGRNEGPREGDERRLLFVSMTRARHNLFITYCRARYGRQARLGRASGRSARCLTRFLRDAPIRAEDGTRHVVSLAQ
jgi:superfamily I DNA/RNA helicase